MCGSVRCVECESGCWMRPTFGFSLGAGLFFLAFVGIWLALGDTANHQSSVTMAGLGFFGLGQLFGRRVDAPNLVEAPPFVPGELLRPARKPLAVAAEPVVDAPAQASAHAHASPEQDETDRLIAHVLAGRQGSSGCRILISAVAAPDVPLGALECAAFASHFSRALSFQGRAILVVLGAVGGHRAGLCELVAGSASFSEAIHRESGSRLHILPAGRGPTPAGQGLDMIVDALSQTYDFVVLVSADQDAEAARRQAIALAPRADHVLLACGGQVGSPDLLALRDALQDAGAGDIVAARIGLAATEARAAA